jgi:hypothetical protein
MSGIRVLTTSGNEAVLEGDVIQGFRELLWSAACVVILRRPKKMCAGRRACGRRCSHSRRVPSVSTIWAKRATKAAIELGPHTARKKGW